MNDALVIVLGVILFAWSIHTILWSRRQQRKITALVDDAQRLLGEARDGPDDDGMRTSGRPRS